MEKAILEAIKYFSYFQYPPTFEEVAMFYPKKITKKRLQEEIDELVKEKKIILLDKDCPDAISNKLSVRRYTLGEYRIKITNYSLRIKNSLKKIERIQFYLKLLSFFPQIKLVGLSGTVAMMNAKENDDIDLFIITARNRLWTGRLIALLLAKIMRIKRPRITNYELRIKERTKDKVCLNLFFEEKKMEVPDYKKTEYVAHEILQMKPLINKRNVYQRFLKANKWIYKVYPNAINPEFRIQNLELNLESRIETLNSKSILNSKLLILNYLSNKIEVFLKNLQLKFIKRHQTNEVVTDSQLWFFPEDFERKLRLGLLVNQTPIKTNKKPAISKKERVSLRRKYDQTKVAKG